MESLNDAYKRLKKIKEYFAKDIPKAYFPSPIKEDYDKGFIDRYFAQKRGDERNPIFEIDEDRFRKTLFPYKKIQIKWFLIGEIEDKFEGNTLIPSVMTLNKKEIEKVEKEMPSLNLYLVNLKQFWKSV